MYHIYFCFFRVNDNLLSAQVLDKVGLSVCLTLKIDNGTQILKIFSNLSDKLFSHENKARSNVIMSLSPLSQTVVLLRYDH